MNTRSSFPKPGAFLLLLILLFNAGSSSQVASGALLWQEKLAPQVLAAMDGESEFIVYLTEQADLSGAKALQTKAEKGRYVFERLAEVAERTQKPVLEVLAANGAEFRPYWIANMIWVRGDQRLVQRLAARRDVARIEANPRVRISFPPDEPGTVMTRATSGVEWNIERINAPQVWARGFYGQGVVVGGQDTGYDWIHPALREKYRGWNGATAEHSYNWHDAIHDASGNPCGSDAAEPCDDDGHGTHTMGIMVGSDPDLAHQIGVAPGAKWIGCRNMDQGYGTPTTYSECYQWFLAPTDSNDQNPDPDKAPDVINNSWGCLETEGCTDPVVLRSVVEAVRAAGILTVQSAGNDGPDCGSVSMPAAIYDASFTVGNTKSTDVMANGSSRGPVTVDGSGRLKPDISAPGTSIYSSVPGGLYTWLSGTSMAAPHVAGLAALLISAQSALRGQPEDLEDMIERFAVPVNNNTQTCGGIPGSTYPNNTAGWGRIDALASLDGHLLRLGKTASAAQVSPGDQITYTLAVRHLAVLGAAHDVVLKDALPRSTDFVSATGPYYFDGSQVRWEFAELAPGESRLVEFTVRAREDFLGTIANVDYGASCDEVAVAIGGEPVYTISGARFFAPFILRVP